MSLQTRTGSAVRGTYPLAVELGLITALLIGVYLWRELVFEVVPAVGGTPLTVGGTVVSAFVGGGVLVLGLVGFTAVYVRWRYITVGLGLPARTDGALVGLAVLTPIVCVAITKLTGAVTAVPYNSLTKTSVASDAAVVPLLLITGLGVSIGVPMLVVVCQVLIQGGFEQVVSADTAIVLTTVLAGFAMVSGTGGLSTVPEAGKLIGAVVFTLSFGVAVYVNERVDRTWLRYLGFVPVLLVTVISFLSGIAGIETIAGALYAGTQLAVLGIAAYTYTETESLLVPAMAYTSLFLANRAVVVVFEAGMQNW
ncbi:hypothetical protein [Halobellus marinus]|uniref:hypothetical protein n=1 Tax=Halobellus TaxID=1073986 RepID=UPI0028A988DD|nr:hypothetical protein [Halobellus sp. DFY28]